MKYRFLLSVIAGFMSLCVTSAVALTTSHDASAKSSPVAIKTVLRSDLSLKTIFSVQLAAPPASGPAVATGIKTCRCSCGQPCNSNADCGGNVCGPGITCCNSSPRGNSLDNMFEQKDLLSSHKNPSSVPATVNCKQ
jgi:hypothetical protein